MAQRKKAKKTAAKKKSAKKKKKKKAQASSRRRTREVHFDFFNIRMPEGVSFEDSFRRIQNVPKQDEDTLAGRFYVARHLEETPSKMLGAVCGASRWDNGAIVSTDGKERPLEMGDNEGLGKEVAFVYDRTSQVITLQRNKQVCYWSRFASYWGYAAELPEPMQLVPIVGKNAMKRMRRLREIRSFTACLPHGVKPEDVGVSPYSPEKMVEFRESLVDKKAKASIEIRISLGRSRKGEFKETRLKRLIQNWLPYASKLEIKGRKKVGDRDQNQILDALDLRETSRQVVTIDETDQVPYAELKNAALRAWSEYEQSFRTKL